MSIIPFSFEWMIKDGYYTIQFWRSDQRCLLYYSVLNEWSKMATIPFSFDGVIKDGPTIPYSFDWEIKDGSFDGDY